METRTLKRCYVRLEHHDIGTCVRNFGLNLFDARRLSRGVKFGEVPGFEHAVVVKVYAKSKP